MFRTIRTRTALSVVVLLALLALSIPAAQANRGDGALGVVFVRSQGLYYDTFVSAQELPPHGRFQLLEMGPHGAETDYGPGDQGYVGGRWMIPDGEGGYIRLLCPLLGPGRETP